MIMKTIDNISIFDRFKHSVWKKQRSALKNHVVTLINFGTGFLLIYVASLIFLSFLMESNDFKLISHIVLSVSSPLFILYFYKIGHCLYSIKRIDEERSFVHFYRMHEICDMKLFQKKKQAYVRISAKGPKGMLTKEISIKNSLFIPEQPSTIYIEN